MVIEMKLWPSVDYGPERGSRAALRPLAEINDAGQAGGTCGAGNDRIQAAEYLRCWLHSGYTEQKEKGFVTF